MGQNWWWVVLAVVVVALLVAVALLRSRRTRDEAPSGNAEIAAAAAGGTAATAERQGQPVAGPGGDAGGGAEPPDRPEPGAAAVDVQAPGRAGLRIPAPREEQPLPRRSTGSGADAPPEPAGSALAALDSGLVAKGSSFAGAAAAVSAAAARPGPYPGSLLPAADGSSPSPDHQVKANEGSRRYHTPDSPYYVRTRGDAWFHTADDARAAGFTPWDAR